MAVAIIAVPSVRMQVNAACAHGYFTFTGR